MTESTIESLPEDRRERVREIASDVRVICANLLDDEFDQLATSLLVDASRVDPFAFERGRSEFWAAGVVHAVCAHNGTFRAWIGPHVEATAIAELVEASHATVSNKSRQVRELVELGPISRDERYARSVRQDGSALLQLFEQSNGEGTPVVDAIIDHLASQVTASHDPRSAIESVFALARGGTRRSRPAPPQKRRTVTRSTYRLKVTLHGTKPPVWRRLEVPASITLAQLHELLQSAMGWTDTHLHCFEIACERFDPVDEDDDWHTVIPLRPEPVDESSVQLGQLVDAGDRFDYTYDFGDNWRHRILVEHVEPLPSTMPEQLPRLVAGRRACPPEDCGGVWGYRHLCALGEAARERYPYFHPAAFDVLEHDSYVRERWRRICS